MIIALLGLTALQLDGHACSSVERRLVMSPDAQVNAAARQFPPVSLFFQQEDHSKELLDLPLSRGRVLSVASKVRACWILNAGY